MSLLEGGADRLRLVALKINANSNLSFVLLLAAALKLYFYHPNYYLTLSLSNLKI